MIIDGKALADKIKKELKNSVNDKDLRLVIVRVGEDPVSERYVERKKKFGLDIGVEVVVWEYPSTISEADLSEEIIRLSSDNKVDGIIIQLPLPKEIKEQNILNLVPPEKDVDALGQEALVLSPIVGAVQTILSEYKVEIKKKKIVVIGQGRLVGKPVSVWLTQEGGDVTIVNSETSSPEKIIIQADIIISGAGEPNLLRPEMLKEGVVLIDAGTSDIFIDGFNKLAGDAHPACAEKCSLFTPVPGGVGPLTVAMLFKNLLSLAR